MQDSLQSLRLKIDQLNKQLVEILAQRFEVTRLVGEHKRDKNLPAKDAVREAESIAKIRTQAEDAGVDPELAAKILQEIMNAVVEQHSQLQRKVIN